MKKLILLIFLISSASLYSGSWKIIGSVNTDLFYGYNVHGDTISWSARRIWIVDSVQHLVDEEDFIKTSTDNGESWFRSLSVASDDTLFGDAGSSLRPTQYNFDDPNLMVLASHQRFIITSNDLGKTWKQTYLLDKEYSYDSLEIGHMAMLDSKHGALSYYYINIGSMYVTGDGWETWKLVELLDKPYIAYINYFDPDTFVIFVSKKFPNFYFLKSFDGGKTWEKLDFNFVEYNLPKIYFKSKDEYWYHVVVKDTTGENRRTQLYKTEDGGKTWQLKLEVPDTTYAGICGMAFADDGRHGVALNSDRIYPLKGFYYYYTSDGGDNWRKIELDTVFNGTFAIEKPVYHNKDYFYFTGTGFVAKIWIDRDTLSVTKAPEEAGNIHAYPNPVKAGSPINFNIKSTGTGKSVIRIFGMNGKETDWFETESLAAGINTVRYNPGKDMIPGMYLVVIESGGTKYECKIIVK